MVVSSALHYARRAVELGSEMAGAAPQWLEALAAGPAPTNDVAAFYGTTEIPSDDDVPAGGMVRYQRLRRSFPNRPRKYNVLYLASSTLPTDWRQQIWVARRKGAAFAWNQDGVAYPGWAGDATEKTNAIQRSGLKAADYVVYQSEFCKKSADEFLGPPESPWEIIHNAVDTEFFTPPEKPPEAEPLTLLLAGHQYERYRLRSALETLAAVRSSTDKVRLVVTGDVYWPEDGADSPRVGRRWAGDLGVDDHVVWHGPYTQTEAPDVFGRAHVLLHTKYKDPCPSVVIEALACGVPVVYSESGGVPELVGTEGGIGVGVEDRWDRQVPPNPRAMAETVLSVVDDLDAYRQGARRRAVERFDVRPWLRRHEEVFEGLVERVVGAGDQ